MSRTARRATTDRSVSGWVKNHSDLIILLPPPGVTYHWYGIPDSPHTPDPFPRDLLGLRSKLQTYDVIQTVGEETYDLDRPDNLPRDTGKRYLWQTNPRVWSDAVERYRTKLKAGKVFPCRHTSGFQTLDAEEGIYECGFELCEERFDRETVERVMQ